MEISNFTRKALAYTGIGSALASVPYDFRSAGYAGEFDINLWNMASRGFNGLGTALHTAFNPIDTLASYGQLETAINLLERTTMSLGTDTINTGGGALAGYFLPMAIYCGAKKGWELLTDQRKKQHRN
jgi:hypothetical protein